MTDTISDMLHGEIHVIFNDRFKVKVSKFCVILYFVWIWGDLCQGKMNMMLGYEA